jgi:hypothetical protein
MLQPFPFSGADDCAYLTCSPIFFLHTRPDFTHGLSIRLFTIRSESAPPGVHQFAQENEHVPFDKIAL